jgi:WD40 repeat protein
MTNRTLLIFIITLLSFRESYSQKNKGNFIFNTANNNINDICFSNKGGVLAIPDGGSIKVYSTVDYKLINEFTEGHTNKILTLKISKDSSLLISGGKDSTVVIWDFIQRKLISKLKFHKGMITALDISPDSKYMAYGSMDGEVLIYNLIEKKIIYELNEKSNNIISAIEFSPDGKFLAVAGMDGLIKLYDLNNGQILISLNGHKGWVRDISFNNIQTQLISCGDDANIVMWDISDVHNIHQQSKKKIGLFAWVLSVDFYGDNSAFATADINGNIEISSTYGNWLTKVGKPINKILFKPNDQFIKLAIATRGDGVILIDAMNMKSKR